MFQQSVLGAIETLYVRIDQYYDEEGALGRALHYSATADSEAAAALYSELSALKGLIQHPALSALTRSVNAEFKQYALGMIDRARAALRALGEEMEELPKELEGTKHALHRLRWRIRTAPFHQNAGSRQDQRFCRKVESQQILRSIGVLFIVLAGGIIIPLLALFIWAYVQRRSVMGLARELLYGKTSSLQMAEMHYAEELESHHYSIDARKEELSFEQRRRFIRRWSKDYDVFLSREALDWFSLKSNFSRYLDFRPHIASRTDCKSLACAMNAECALKKWGEGAPERSCTCCAVEATAQVFGDAEDMAYDSDEGSATEALAAGAALTAATAVVAASASDHQEDDSFVEESFASDELGSDETTSEAQDAVAQEDSEASEEVIESDEALYADPLPDTDSSEMADGSVAEKGPVQEVIAHNAMQADHASEEEEEEEEEEDSDWDDSDDDSDWDSDSDE